MRRREIPAPSASRARIAEAGIDFVPPDGPDAQVTRGLLDMVAYFADARKRIAFPGFTWATPSFRVDDDKVAVHVVYEPLASLAALDEAMARGRARIPAGAIGLVALDANGLPAVREFDITHALYGEVTLFEFPRKPAQSADLRIHAAEEAGWTPTLKAHNLMPGRGIVVLDEHHGRYLTDPSLSGLVGVVVLFASGFTGLYWNPFCDQTLNDSEMQHWLTWGPGSAPSQWRDMLHVTSGPDDVPR